ATVALDWNASGFADGVFESSDRLLLRRGRAGHVKNFLFDNRPVQIIRAITERNLRQRQTCADPVGGEMIDVIQVDPAEREIAQLFNRRGAFDMSEHGRLRFESEWNETAKAAGFILELAQLT